MDGTLKQKLTFKSRISAREESEILARTFLTIEDVAQVLGVCRRYVYYLIDNGKLNACRLSYQITIIIKDDLMKMIKENDFVKQKPALASKKTKTIRRKPYTPKVSTPQKGEIKELSPTSYPMPLKDEIKDVHQDNDELYTMDEVCHKYNYTYGRLYNLRMRYSIPEIKKYGKKCFPKTMVDHAIQAEIERLGKTMREHWYSCFDIMRIYGLGKTQVKRFAEKYHVRIKRAGHKNLYLKDDWEDARLKSMDISHSTKPKRGK